MIITRDRNQNGEDQDAHGPVGEDIEAQKLIGDDWEPQRASFYDYETCEPSGDNWES